MWRCWLAVIRWTRAVISAAAEHLLPIGAVMRSSRGWTWGASSAAAVEARAAGGYMVSSARISCGVNHGPSSW